MTSTNTRPIHFEPVVNGHRGINAMMMHPVYPYPSQGSDHVLGPTTGAVP